MTMSHNKQCLGIKVLYCFMFTEGNQKPKENEAKKKEKTAKSATHAETKGQVYGTDEEVFWYTLCKALLDT